MRPGASRAAWLAVVVALDVYGVAAAIAAVELDSFALGVVSLALLVMGGCVYSLRR